MTKATLYPDWRACVQHGTDGPRPQLLMLDERVKVVVAGLEAGQSIPAHAEATAVYHFLEGRGWLIVDGARLPVGPGATVVVPDGAVRGMEAELRLAFLATRVTGGARAAGEE